MMMMTTTTTTTTTTLLEANDDVAEVTTTTMTTMMMATAALKVTPFKTSGEAAVPHKLAGVVFFMETQKSFLKTRTVATFPEQDCSAGDESAVFYVRRLSSAHLENMIRSFAYEIKGSWNPSSLRLPVTPWNWRMVIGWLDGWVD